MTAYTLSASAAGGGAWGDIALVFTGATVTGIGASKTATGSGAGQLTLTTAKASSAIAVLVLDWNGTSGASRTWLTVNGTTPTAGNGFELEYTLLAGNYASYAAYYPDAGSAGPKLVGLSAPTGMVYTVVAVEIQGTPAGQQAALPVSFTISARPLATLLPVGLSLTTSAVTFSGSVTLPVGTDLDAAVAGWIFTGQVPLTYLQYLGPAGTLTAAPGVLTAAVTPASGYAFPLPVPPGDGRWISPFGGPDIDMLERPAPARVRRHGDRHRSGYQMAGAR